MSVQVSRVTQPMVCASTDLDHTPVPVSVAGK